MYRNLRNITYQTKQFFWLTIIDLALDVVIERMKLNNDCVHLSLYKIWRQMALKA